MKQKSDISIQLGEKSEYDLFTGGETKSADLAIYYNVALESMTRIEKQISSWPSTRQKSFWAEYFWKAHQLKKNENGYEVTLHDEWMIQQLKEKVDAIRNFHSHIWHDNNVLIFEKELKDFVEQKYEEAKAALYEQFPGALSDYENLENKEASRKFKLFNWVQDKRKNFITVEGRIFFLSFFLTTGQMNQLLQQRKGFKRSDMPLFKIKRMLYTYYCHRDGASLADINHDTHVLNTLVTTEKRNILKARTAYKLLSYLFDYPHYWGDRTYMPLFDNNNEIIKNVERLKSFIESENNLLPGLTFQLLDTKAVNDIDFADDRERDDFIKHQENKFRTGTISFTVTNLPGYTFHINFETLHRLVLLQILHKNSQQEKQPLEILIETLKSVAENRSRLYNILIAPADRRSEEDLAYLQEKKNQRLRGSRKLTELGIIYFEDIEKGKIGKMQMAIQLANKIRRSDINQLYADTERKEPREPEPIEVYEHDFILGLTQKFRAGNRFMHYSAQYLVDFAGDDWYWGVEKFELSKKNRNARTESLLKIKTYLKASEIHAGADYRLTLENDHIHIALARNVNGKANYERFFEFTIGPQAMRYLVTYIIHNKDNYTNKLHGFLTDLAADMERLQSRGSFNEDDGYKLLEKKYVTRFTKDKSYDPDKLKKQVRSRIDNICNQWKYALGNKPYLTRSQKNRLVMDAYRLFDWPKGANGVPRFFRAHEFNQMSVCHYSLHKKNEKFKDDPRSGRRRSDKSKYDYYFENLFKLNDREPPIPNEIMAILDKVDSLDTLMEVVFKDRESYLHSRFGNWAALVQSKELAGFCRLLGISVPPEILREKERTALKEKQRITLLVQPYAIDPMLVVKYFYPGDYKLGQIKSMNEDSNQQSALRRPGLQIFNNLRKNKSRREKLVDFFYDKENLDLIYKSSEQKKQKQKVIGLMDTTCTEDIMLWWMAGQYLVDNIYTRDMGAFVNRQSAERRNYIGDFYRLPVTMPIYTEKENKRIYIQVLMHNLDDLIFVMQQDQLAKAADHYLNRCKNESELWKKELDILQNNVLAGRPLPDGSPGNPIPFQLLIDEIELVRRTGQELTKHILLFERKVLEQRIGEMGSKEKLHQWLKDEYEKTAESKIYPAYFYNFENILSLAGTMGMVINEPDCEALNEVRNIAIHNDIPVHSSFSWLMREGQPLRILLGVVKDLHAKSDRSEYYIDKGN